MGEHWTEEWFVERPSLLAPAVEAGAGDAKTEVENLLERVRERYGLDPDTVLDAACGRGRHAVALAERGLDVTGVDLSPSYVEAARERAAAAGVADRTTFREADLRELDAAGRHDLAVNLFTSFGFYDDNTNRAILKHLHGALVDGGVLVMQVANRDGLLSVFDPDSVRKTEDLLLAKQREYDPETARMAETRTVFERTDGDSRWRHSGSVDLELRLYAPVELKRLFRDAGFREVGLTADLSGADLERDSTHQVVWGRA